MKLSQFIFRKPKLFKRMKAPYRMVLIDDESLEEVASFKLTKTGMYIFFSTLFVVIVTVTVLILLLTPMKYYIPGYGDNRTHRETVRLRKNVDSLADLVSAQQAYLLNIQTIMSGGYTRPEDTSLLDLDKVRKDALNSILPNEAIKREAIKAVKAKKK